MKNILIKFDIHYSFLIIALGLVLTGYFSNLIAFLSLIIVHELGHAITATLLKYKVEKIIIYPYGGITMLDTMINTNIYKDLLVAVSGIIFQCIYFFVIYFLYINGFVREYIYNLFLIYHKSMILFNLFPIIPLDGFKIMNLLLSKYFNFNLSNNLSVLISLISIIILIVSDIFEKNYSVVLIISILMRNIYNFYNQISYIYNRFLLERYLYNFNYKKRININNQNKMYKNATHFFVKDGKIISEKDYLTSFFRKKR